MGLILGRIPFKQDHTPYRAPEKGRRSVEAHEAERRRGVEAGASPGPAALPQVRQRGGPTTEGSGAASTSGPVSRHPELSIRPDGVGPVDVPFLLGATRERMGRSAAASIGSHIVAGGLLILIISLAPEPIIQLVEPNRENYGIVWLPSEGHGGGGGGGGNESLELPRQVELQGQDETALSVPVEPEPDYVEPEVEEPELLQTQQMNIPAVAMASATNTRAGVFEGLMAASTVSQGSGLGGGGGSGEGTGIGPSQGPGLGPGVGGGVGGGVYRPGAGIEIPQPLHRAKPRYTAEAMRAKIQGSVWLEAVVLPDGTVGDVSVTKSLDTVFGLDGEAIRAARQWRFAPGTRFGEPVPVLVVIELTFTLR